MSQVACKPTTPNRCRPPIQTRSLESRGVRPLCAPARHLCACGPTIHLDCASMWAQHPLGLCIHVDQASTWIVHPWGGQFRSKCKSWPTFLALICHPHDLDLVMQAPLTLRLAWTIAISPDGWKRTWAQSCSLTTQVSLIVRIPQRAAQLCVRHWQGRHRASSMPIPVCRLEVGLAGRAHPRFSAAQPRWLAGAPWA